MREGERRRMKCPSHLLSVSMSADISSRNLNEIDRCDDVGRAKSARASDSWPTSGEAGASADEGGEEVRPLPESASASPLISFCNSLSSGSAFLSQKPAALYLPRGTEGGGGEEGMPCDQGKYGGHAM